MRSFIALCLLLIVACAGATPVESPPTSGVIFAYAETGIEAYNDNAKLFETTDAKMSCSIGWCIDTCWSFGFRPPFTAQCVSASTCRCTQY